MARAMQTLTFHHNPYIKRAHIGNRRSLYLEILIFLSKKKFIFAPIFVIKHYELHCAVLQNQTKLHRKNLRLKPLLWPQAHHEILNFKSLEKQRSIPPYLNFAY